MQHLNTFEKINLRVSNRIERGRYENLHFFQLPFINSSNCPSITSIISYTNIPAYIHTHIHARIHTLHAGPLREFRVPSDKREIRGLLRAKRSENFQGLEINFGKLMLVYIMRPPRL